MPKHKKRTPPKVGTTFKKKYKGFYHTMKVVKKTENVSYMVAGVTYKTPTAAAVSITKAKTNGWKFWRIDI